MNEIRAFVGHSFTSDDEQVVGAFLSYFDQISGIYPSFTWQHATSSEPRDLRDKVLSMIADKNVFIGICTKKERVATDKLFKRGFIARMFLKIAEIDLAWKTSDWVIQEIGLAIGRGMSVILLVEEGVRQPGGLQGNIEYISFKRSSPAECFGQVLEMVRAISPPSSPAIAAPRELVVADVAEKHSAKEDVLQEPSSDWSRDSYLHAHIKRMLNNDAVGAGEVYDAFLKSGLAPDAEARAEWEAATEWAKIVFGKGGSLGRLRELAAQYSDSPDIQSYLGYSLSMFGEPAEAAAAHERAAACAKDPAVATGQLCKAAIQSAKAHQFDRAWQILELATATVAERVGREDVLSAIKEIAEITDDKELVIEALEGLVELNPENRSWRFSLAYEHDQIGNKELSLLNYLKVPWSERDPTLWNNLGVAYQEFEMPGKSVSAYRQSAGSGETLAMSNLGHKFMEAGFFEEAESEFRRALDVEDFHKNVASGLAALKSAPEQENKKEGEVLQAASEKASFYRMLGRAIVAPSIKIGGRWNGPVCELNVVTSGRKFRAEGKYERANALLAAIGQEQRKMNYVAYEGTIVGRRIEGTIRRWSDGDKSSTSLVSIAGSNENPKFTMVLNEAGRVLEVMENPTLRRPSRYRLDRLD